MINDHLFVTDSSEASSEALLPFWLNLKNNNFKFDYCGCNFELTDFFHAHRQGVIDFSWPKYPNGFAMRLYFWLMFPFWFFKLLFKIHDRKPACVITTGIGDSLLIASLSRVIDFKHYWLMLPELQDKVYEFKLLRKLIKNAYIFAFSSLAKNRLEQLGFKNRSSVFLPSFDGDTAKHQENIFNTLAQKENPRRKFFTVATFTDLTQESHLENLLKAAKEIREVVPNLQIIIVGDGPEKKNLLWIAKTLGIESTVWFVGSTEKTFKWLENLDLYIYTKAKVSLKEQIFSLEVMSRKIPIIADIGAGLDDLIFDGKTGQLVIFKNINDLAQTIINLEQDVRLREQMGEESKKRVQELFTPHKTLDQFVKVL